MHSLKRLPSKTNGKTQGCCDRGPAEFVRAHLGPLTRVGADPEAKSGADSGDDDDDDGDGAAVDEAAEVASRGKGEHSQYSQLPYSQLVSSDNLWPLCRQTSLNPKGCMRTY